METNKTFAIGVSALAVSLLFCGLHRSQVAIKSGLCKALTPKEIISARAERDARTQRNSLIQAVGQKYDFNGDGVLSYGEALLTKEAVEGRLNRSYKEALNGFSQAELEYLATQGEQK